jgi:hypothetical protein
MRSHKRRFALFKTYRKVVMTEYSHYVCESLTFKKISHSPRFQHVFLSNHTSAQLQSYSNNMEAFPNKRMEVQGCSYLEYRGRGPPPSTITPQATPGDIYLDVVGPYQVWVRRTDGWKEWQSMQTTQKCPHPSQPRILMPTTKRFSWVPSSGIETYTRTVLQRLSNRKDDANTHVGIILSGEGIIQAPPIVSTQLSQTEAMQVETEGETSEDEDTDADTDADMSSDREGEVDVERQIGDISMGSHSSTDDSTADKEQDQARHSKMRTENASIHKAVEEADCTFFFPSTDISTLKP